MKNRVLLDIVQNVSEGQVLCNMRKPDDGILLRVFTDREWLLSQGVASGNIVLLGDSDGDGLAVTPSHTLLILVPTGVVSR